MRRGALVAILTLGLVLPSIAAAGRIKLSSDASSIDIKLEKKGDPSEWFSEGSAAALGLADLFDALVDDDQKKLKKKLKRKLVKKSGGKAKLSFGTGAGDLIAKLSRPEMRSFLREMREMKTQVEPPVGGVPEPGTALLMATGFLGLAGANARIRRKR